LLSDALPSSVFLFINFMEHLFCILKVFYSSNYIYCLRPFYMPVLLFLSLSFSFSHYQSLSLSSFSFVFLSPSAFQHFPLMLYSSVISLLNYYYLHMPILFSVSVSISISSFSLPANNLLLFCLSVTQHSANFL